MTATRVNPTAAQQIKYTDLAVGSVMVGSNGYLNLTTSVPAAAMSASLKLLASIKYWDTNTEPVTLVWYPNGNFYVMSKPNARITDLNVRFWYI